MDGHAGLGEEGDGQEAAQMEGEYVEKAKEDVQWVPETWVRPINRENPKVIQKSMSLEYEPSSEPHDPASLVFTDCSQVDMLGVCRPGGNPGAKR